MASICRLCATLRKIESFVNLHDTTLDICMKLEKCCQIVVPRTNDALPQNVCNECVLSLNDSWKFFQKVHESQESLSKIFYIQGSNSNVENSTEKFYTQNSQPSKSSENNITSSSDNNMNPTQNMEVERLLHNITIIPDNNRTNEMGQSVSDNDPEKGLKIEIAEQLTFDGLDESDFAIATGSIVAANGGRNDRRYGEIRDEGQANQDIDELQLHNLPNEIHVDENVHETETNKFVDQTIDQIENQFEDEEYQNDEMDSSNNLENTDNSNSTTMLSTSLSRSMLMESLNESELETLGSWNDYNWKCVYCSEFITDNADNLRLHVYTEHQDQPIKYVCTDCHKTFDKYYTFINHVKLRHRMQLQLCCDLCSEFFDTANVLAAHRSTAHVQEIHFGNVKSNENNLAYCSVCAKAFKNKTALVVHAKGHIPSEQKYKFPCDYCDKIFATKANWKAHNKIHVGLKDFVCALCGRGFVQKANLDEHMLTHSEEKPFECEECHRRVLNSNTMSKGQLKLAVEKQSPSSAKSLSNDCTLVNKFISSNQKSSSSRESLRCKDCKDAIHCESLEKNVKKENIGETCTFVNELLDEKGDECDNDEILKIKNEPIAKNTDDDINSEILAPKYDILSESTSIEVKNYEITNTTYESELEYISEDNDDETCDVEYDPLDINSDENNSSLRKRNKRKNYNTKMERYLLKKMARNFGKAYESQNKFRKARKMKPVCTEKCKLKCFTKFTEKERLKIFSEYWNLGDIEKQRLFISNSMKVVNSLYRKYYKYSISGIRGPRQNNNSFYFRKNDEEIRVCKIFFINTLDINNRNIQTVIAKQSTASQQDLRGKHGKHKSVDETIKQNIRDFINSIEKIQKHCIHQNISKQFIEGTNTISHLHKNYVNDCESKGISFGGYTLFYRIFNEEFKLQLFNKKKYLSDKYCFCQDLRSIE